MLRRIILAIASGLALFLAIGLTAASAADEAKKTPAKPAAATAKEPAAKPAADTASQGMRVFIDPATGKIRPPEQEEVQQLAPAPAGTPAGTPRQLGAGRRAEPMVTSLQGPGGAIGMKLDDSQMVYSVATKNADGSISFECLTGKADAAKKVSSKPVERSQLDDK